MKKKIIAALTLALLILWPVTPSFAESISVERISGTSRFDTAVEVSKASYKEATAAVLVNGHRFIDALPGSTLANLYKAPILLANQEDLPSQTLGELKRLGVRRIFMLGGPLVLSDGLEGKLQSLGFETTRIAGGNRYETSEKIYSYIAERVDIREVVIAASEVDSVSSSGYRQNLKPLIFVDKNNPSLFVRSLNVDKTVLGGKLALSEEVYGALSATKRISGNNRFETALALAKATDFNNVILVNSHSFIDALTSGVLSYITGSDVLLTPRDALDSATEKYIHSLKPDKALLVGGPLAVSAQVEKQLSYSGDYLDYISGDKGTFGYWNYINNYSTTELMSQKAIQAFNADNIAYSSYMQTVEEAAGYSKAKVAEKISALSKIPSATRYDEGGRQYTSIMNSALTKNLNTGSVENKALYAVALRRTDLRTFPSYKESHKRGGSVDYFQETAIYPWEECVIHHESADKGWYFVTNYYYSGWVPKKDLAIVDYDTMIQYTRSKDFLVVTDRQVTIDGVLYDMSSRIPLKSSEGVHSEIYVPRRAEDGKFYADSYTLKKSASFHQGYPLYSKANLIRQALKFYGEPYGWGGKNNVRDCSGVLVDSYRTFGLLIPRNSYQQGKSSLGKVTNLTRSTTLSAKLNILRGLAPGSGLYMEGHAMMYLGLDKDNTPYIIHQYAGHYENGKYIQRDRCDVTPATIRTSSGKTFLEACYSAVEFLR